jgi:hypothetical protein
MLWWYRIRDSKGWPFAVIGCAVLVFVAGFALGSRGEPAVVLQEAYRRPSPTVAPPVTATVPLTSTTLLANPTATQVPLEGLDVVRTLLNNMRTEMARNRVEEPTMETVARFFASDRSTGLFDADADGFDDDHQFTFVGGTLTTCIYIPQRSDPGLVAEGACL